MINSGRLPLPWCLLAAAAALAALLQLNAVREPIAGLTAAVGGDFVLEDDAARTRIWTTKGDDGVHQGHLMLGPLRTTRTIRVQVSGQPQAPGNQVYFENRTTGETIAPTFLAPEEFRVPLSFTPPATWVGAEIYLHAVDASPAPATWVAVSEPVAIPAWAAWFGGAPSRVCTFLFVGVTLAICTLAGILLVRRFGLDHEPLRLIAALGLVAIAGYAVFWCFFASPVGGVIVTSAVLLGAVISVCRPGAATTAWRSRDCAVPALLMLAVGTFDVAALHRYGGEAPMSALAQYRFIGNQPSDNQLPQDFARALERGSDPRGYAGTDWRSSDRPPLQSGWLLLLARPAVFLRAGYNAAMQSAGVWFQLLWIPAVWAWLRSSGEQPRTVAAIIVAISASGFFFFHGVYVWPKLACAAFVLTTFTCWFVVRDDSRSRGRRISAGAAAAALGWLAHGGAAFSLLALGPLLCARRRTLAGARRWLGAAAVFAALTLPWLVYQTLYDPPGNRLLKWHLAGVTGVDDRGTLETLADAYGAQTTAALLHARIDNARTIFAGAWPALLRFDFTSPESRRHHEWFHTFFALGWWNLGLLATLFGGALHPTEPRQNNRRPSIVLSWLRRRDREGSDLAWPLGWVVMTLGLWVALLFQPGTAFIHHGSFAPLLVLFPLGALALWRMHPVAFGAVTIVQIATFGLVWLSRPAAWPGLPASTSALVIMAGAALVAGVVVWRTEAVSDSPPRGDDTTAPRRPPRW